MRNLLNRRVLTALVCTLGVLLTVSSCENDDVTIEQVESLPSDVTSEIQRKVDFIRSSGFEEDDIIYRDGDFVVDNDILISEKDVEERMKVHTGANARITQSRSEYIVDQQRVEDIKVAFVSGGSRSIGENTRDAFLTAMKAWNESGSKVKFRRVNTYGDYDILVYRVDDSRVLSDARFPSSSGAPGYEVRVNVDRCSNYSYLWNIRMAGHELGHTVGLAHSNNAINDPFKGDQIPFTPSRGAEGISSIMNSSIYADEPYLTNGDKEAVQYLYPLHSSMYVEFLSHNKKLDEGRSYTIRWNPDDLSGSQVKISLYRNGIKEDRIFAVSPTSGKSQVFWGGTTDPLPNDGSRQWSAPSVPSSDSERYGWQIKVESISDPNQFHLSEEFQVLDDD